jgi:hypothetical protein
MDSFWCSKNFAHQQNLHIEQFYGHSDCDHETAKVGSHRVTLQNGHIWMLFGSEYVMCTLSF